MDGLITFIIITLLIIIVPGPDFIIVMKNTINSSKMNGFMAAFGITTGHILYSSLAIFGIIYILTSLHFVFLTIKILGACYLIYLGIKSILSAHSSVDFSKQTLADVRNVSYITSFRQGFSNGNIHMKSEVALFAFSVVVVICLWFLFCVFIFQYIKLLFSRPRFKAIFDYIVGFVLIGLSINLLLSKSS